MTHWQVSVPIEKGIFRRRGRRGRESEPQARERLSYTSAADREVGGLFCREGSWKGAHLNNRIGDRTCKRQIADGR